MVVFSMLWGSLLPPTLLNYARWCKTTIDEAEHQYSNWMETDFPSIRLCEVENTPINFIKQTNPDDYYVFISNEDQDVCLQEALDKFNLHKYIVHETVKFINPNTYSVPTLKMYVFNFKDFKIE